MGENANVSVLSGNNPWRGTPEIAMVGRNEHTDGKRAEHVKDQNPPDEPLDRPWDIPSRVDGFTCGQSDHFDTAISKGREHESGK